VSQLVYQLLTAADCLSVLRTSHVTRAAFTDGEKPYLVPMAFQLEAEGKDADGKTQTIRFTYVLKCEDMPDLNLVLEWNRYNGETGAITCLADRTANRTVESVDLENGIFAYKPTLTGSEAENAQLISGEYRCISGETGELDLTGGTLQLRSSIEKGKSGTSLVATFDTTSIDCMPLGDVISTICILIAGSPEIDFEFSDISPKRVVSLKTAELREVLGEEISLAEPEIQQWIQEYLKEQYTSET